MAAAAAHRGLRTNALSRTLVALVCAATLLPSLSFLGFRARAPQPRGASQHVGSHRSALRVSLEDLLASSRTDAKNNLLDLLSDEGLGEEVSKPEGKPTLGRLNELISVVEKLNPCEEPAYDDLLDGLWTVKYAGSYAPGLLSSPTRELALFLYGGGFSLGNALSSFSQGFWGQSLGLKLGAKKVRIQDARDVEATAEVEVGGQKQTLTYTAELLPLSARRLNEEVTSFDLPEPLGKRDVPLELRRSVLITFLDDDMMIVRDETGVPEVLVRELAAPAATPEPPAVPAVADGIAQDPMSADAA